MKRKTSARDDNTSNKRSRRDRTGRVSTSGAISEMSRAIGEMAAVFGGGSQTDDLSEPARLNRAVKMLEQEVVLTVIDKAKLMLMAQKDIGFADLILSVEDEETRQAVYRLKLTM